VILVLLVLAVVFGLGMWAGSHHGRHARVDRFDGPGHSRLHGMPGPGAPGWPGQRGFGPGGADRRGEWGPGGPAGPGAMFRGPGSGVVGTVASVNGPTLVVNQDGGQQVSVPTTAQTRVVGDQRASVAELRPGDRVAVREDANHQAVAVLVVPARAAGTVTTLTGDQATVTTPGGLNIAVDVSGVPTKPKVGDRVVVTGTATNNGSSIKASQLRVMPPPPS
jgi:hypothetical protein